MTTNLLQFNLFPFDTTEEFMFFHFVSSKTKIVGNIITVNY